MIGRLLVVAVLSAPLLVVTPPIQVPTVNAFAPLTRAEFVRRLERLYRKMDTHGRGYFTADDLVLPGYHIADPPAVS